MEIPWYGIGSRSSASPAWAVVVISGGLANARRKSRSRIRRRGAAKRRAQQAVLARLDAIDTRLGVIEKTLTDIH